MIITDEEALRIECEDVKGYEIGSLVGLLEEELKRSASLGRKGIGLAAPQIGIAKKIAIVRIDDAHSVDLVNARIVKGYDKDIFDNEGCLSFPGRYERTMRYSEIQVENQLIDPFNFICTGLFAVVVQHELDHLAGRLLPDVALPRLVSAKKKARPNDPCPCGSKKKYKRCCGLK